VIAFRCDGGDRVGAGHVARCLQIAAAFRMAGDEPLFVGQFDGLAAALLEAGGMEAVAPTPDAPLGVPPGADLAVLDSYELEPAEAGVPVAAIEDGPLQSRPGVIPIDYHLDASGPAIAGPAYAPVAPALAAARRERGFERALVTVGGGSGGAQLRSAALEACRDHGLEPVETGAGLAGAIEQADVAVSAAGLTAYELACAGVPAGLVSIAPNQERVARTFAGAGLAITGDDPKRLVGRLADAGVRESLAGAGPAAVDGYGAFRVRDALRAIVAGAAVAEPLRYRPATAADSTRQLEWRNDPATRAVSRTTHEIQPAEHERWFEGVLGDGDRRLLVVEDRAGPAGSVRFDIDGREAEISVMIAPERRSEGLGTRAVRESSELLLASTPALERVRAEVAEGNEGSLGAFRRAGFTPATGGGGTGASVLLLDRAALASRPT
jgi:spore coat polysaccharide biosynthesis predicted glycosyltransferase SpsG/RimJ/RimL family protein N-acetyltransferase